MDAVKPVLSNLDTNLNNAVERLFELLKIQSISTDPAFAPQCVLAADWLVQGLRTIGFDARLCPTGGHPMVLARHEGPAGAPHVLFYGHYDVQPVDPIELWRNPPFDPVIEEGDDGIKRIFARGAADDKGQLMTFVEALRAWKQETGDTHPYHWRRDASGNWYAIGLNGPGIVVDLGP